MLISLDAFNSVRILDNCGLNQEIIKTSEALYNKLSARLKINDTLTDSLLLDPQRVLYPLLFTFFIEPLAQSLSYD